MSLDPVSLTLPSGLLDEIAQRVAVLVFARIGESASSRQSPYMSITEAADYLRCERQRIDDLLSQRRLSRVKEGGRTLVIRDEVERYLVHQAKRDA